MALAALLLAHALLFHPCLMRHEIAHVNGWPSNHPNGHYEEACGHILMPPPEYDHDATIPVNMIYYSPDRVDRECGHKPGYVTEACAWTWKHEGYIIFPST